MAAAASHPPAATYTSTPLPLPILQPHGHEPQPQTQPEDGLSRTQTSSHTRRLRPPTIESFAEDTNRVPLRPEKLQRRESKMGLRSLFGRSSRSKDHDADPPADPRPAGGIRASIVDFTFNPARSEAQLSTEAPPSDATSSSIGLNKTLPPLPSLSRRTTLNGRELRPHNTNPISPVSTTRGSVATWEPPPLFQAYPQAIRHAHLPATTTSPEAILRHNNKKNDLGHDDLSPTAMDNEDDPDAESTAHERGYLERPRRRHRRNTSTSTIKLDWTTKVYVLATSGYLLQYSGDGNFDRLPEKILHLGKTSAAFVSDSIPGRHWVLQVCSSMEADGTPASDSRSIFSRIPFRSEKRNASNFLMVFEDADDMESWIVLLRREIEALGGKKNLSETGKPKIVEALVSGPLRHQPNQRTLVVRDPERFSRSYPQESVWSSEGSEPHSRPYASESLEPPPENSYDDVSTTTSLASQDGRQLDGLRDNTNRLSYLSSGQRTGITSAGSSPAGSPIQERFLSDKEDGHFLGSFYERTMDMRRLSNPGIVVNERRQSMQSLAPIVDYRPNPTTPVYPDSVSPHSTTPNFSVPNAVGRRYSFVKSPTAEFPPAPLHDRAPLATGMRKGPPTALPMTRPLSIVRDQPSPISPHLRDEVTAAPDSATLFSSWTHQPAKTGAAPSSPPAKYPARRSSFVPVQDTIAVTVKPNPRRFSSMQALRSSSLSSESIPETQTFFLPQPTPAPQQSVHVPVSIPKSEPPRCRSAFDGLAPQRSALLPSTTVHHNKMASYMSMSPPRPRHLAMDSSPTLPLQRPLEVTVTEFDLPSRPMSRSRHMSVASHLASPEMRPRNLINRRSLPHLAEGPPPAPPPSCALPPIPQERADTSPIHWNPIHI